LERKALHEWDFLEVQKHYGKKKIVILRPKVGEIFEF
jgi:hypothetical protein